MKKKTYLTGLIFGILWCGVKFISYLLNWDSPETLSTFVMLNLLFATFSIIVALLIVNNTRNLDRNLLMDFKTGITSGFIYTLVVSFFIYMYYDKINPDFNKSRINKRKIELSKHFDISSKNVEAYRGNNPEWKSLNKKELLEEDAKATAYHTSPKITMIFSLSGLLLWTTLNSIVISLIFRRFLFRVRFNSKK